MAINACASLQAQETNTAEVKAVVSPQPTQSFYFEPLNNLVETQNEIEMKVIDVGKDAQNVFVDICFTLPDDKNDWFVSFETSAVVKSDVDEQNMSLQKISLIGFEPFYPFPDSTHRCDRLLFESFNDEPTDIDLRIEEMVGITKKQKNCAASDITFDSQIVIEKVSCISTDGSPQNQEGSSSVQEQSTTTIQGPWVFKINIP
jgi:hypothetical protein